MAKYRRRRFSLLGGGAILTLSLALVMAGLSAAQSHPQLPGVALTTDPANDLRPAWSPDGTRIAFHSARSGNNDVWVMNSDGGNQGQLTDDPGDDRRPAWSPDGAWIAFDSDRSGDRDIWVMSANGENARQLTSGAGDDTFAAWSPDGTQIAFYSYARGVTDLWVVDLRDFLDSSEAGEARRVTNGLANEQRNQCTFACHTPGWDPTGKQIAVPAMNHTQIWIVGTDGSDPYQITAGGEQEHFPTWMPDGKIIFLSERVTDKQEHVNDVWVIDADGGNAAVLYSAIPHGGPLEFKPDGVTIAFQSPRAGNFDIYTTMLGQAAAPTAVAQSTNAPGSADFTPPSQPTIAPAATVAAPAAQADSLPAPALVGAIALVVIGGGLVALYLIRRGRSS